MKTLCIVALVVAAVAPAAGPDFSCVIVPLGPLFGLVLVSVPLAPERPANHGRAAFVPVRASRAPPA